MAITSFGPLWVPTPLGAVFNQAPSTITLTMNAAGQAYGVRFRVPKTGTLETVEFALSTVFQAPTNGLRISFQDLSSGFPDGTQDQYRDVTSGISTGAWIVPGAMTSDGTDGGSKRSVTAGDYLGIVIEFVSFVTGDSLRFPTLDNSGTRATYMLPKQRGVIFRNASGVWSDQEDEPLIALKYTDGSYAQLGTPWFPIKSLNATNFNSSSTPNERGLRFVLPFGARVSGAWVRCALPAAADVVLYDASDNVLASSSLSADLNRNGNAYVPFAPTELAAGTYRLTFKPTTTSNVSLYDFDVESNAHLAAVEGGVEWYYTERTDGGSWTDTTTKRPWMGLLFDGIDVGGSSGGGAFAYAFMG